MNFGTVWINWATLSCMQWLRLWPNTSNIIVHAATQVMAESIQHYRACSDSGYGRIHPTLSCMQRLRLWPNPSNIIVHAATQVMAESIQHYRACSDSGYGRIHPTLNATHTCFWMCYTLDIFLVSCISVVKQLFASCEVGEYLIKSAWFCDSGSAFDLRLCLQLYLERDIIYVKVRPIVK